MKDYPPYFKDIISLSSNDIQSRYSKTVDVSTLNLKKSENQLKMLNIKVAQKADSPEEKKGTGKVPEQLRVNYTKKNKIIIISLIVLSFLVLASIILMIGHFWFGWFMKKNELVVEQKRETNSVVRYLENKNAYNYYDIEGLSQEQKMQNISIFTDFIIAINKIKKINKFFSESDYLYEAFLLIINVTEANETESIYLGGLDIYDNSKSLQELIQQNNDLIFNYYSEHEQNFTLKNKTEYNESIPICKYYFYKNGTIVDIYFPKNTNEFYKSEIVDLIKKVTPKLSKSLYQNENNVRRLENGEKDNTILNYEQILTNGEISKTIIYENETKGDKNENNDQFNYEKRESNSRIKRIFNSSGDMISLEMEGEAFFKSGPSTKNKNIHDEKEKNLRLNEEIKGKGNATNDSYYSLGFNEFKMNVKSNIELIKNSIEPNILESLNKLTKQIIFEEYKQSNTTLEVDEGNETDVETNENFTHFNHSEQFNQTNNKRILSDEINYPRSYRKSYTAVSTSFLGLSFGYELFLFIDNTNGVRQAYSKGFLGGNEIPFPEVEKRQNSNNKRDSAAKSLSAKRYGLSINFNIFGFSIGSSFYVKFSIYHGVSFEISNGEMYSRSFSSFSIGAEGSFGPNFIIVSFKYSLRGTLASGYTYIEANTLLNYGSKITRFYFYRRLDACSLDIYFSFTINLIFWKKTYETTLNLFRLYSSSQSYYSYD